MVLHQVLCIISTFVSNLSFIALLFVYIFLFMLALWMLVSLYCYTVEVVIWLILERRNLRNVPRSLIDIMVPDPYIRFMVNLTVAETGVWISGLTDKYFRRGAAAAEEEKHGLCTVELPITLPQISFKSNGEMETSSINDCAICLDEFVEDEMCRSLPACNHIFHLQCIDQWLKHRLNCPICRNPATVVDA